MSIIWRKVKSFKFLRRSLIDSQSCFATSAASVVVTSSFVLWVRLVDLDRCWVLLWAAMVDFGEDCLGCGLVELLLEDVGGSADELSTQLHIELHSSSNPWQRHSVDRSTEDCSVGWYSSTVKGLSIAVLGTISSGDMFVISLVRRLRAVVFPTRGGPMKNVLSDRTGRLPCCSMSFSARFLFCVPAAPTHIRV